MANHTHTHTCTGVGFFNFVCGNALGRCARQRPSAYQGDFERGNCLRAAKVIPRELIKFACTRHAASEGSGSNLRKRKKKKYTRSQKTKNKRLVAPTLGRQHSTVFAGKEREATTTTLSFMFRHALVLVPTFIDNAHFNWIPFSFAEAHLDTSRILQRRLLKTPRKKIGTNKHR